MEEKKILLEELKDRQFSLQMKDRWTREDYELDNKLYDQIRDLEKEIYNEFK